MRRKTILTLAVVSEIPDGIVMLTLTLMKEIYLPLIMLVIFEGMFVTEATAQTSLQTKILATAAQPTTDEATQKIIDELIKRLGDKDVSVRMGAANGLNNIALRYYRDPQAARPIKQAFQPLIKSLGDENASVRGLVAQALGKIGDPKKS